MGILGNNKPEIGRAIITIANILNILNSDMLVEIDFFVHKFLLDNCLRIIEKEKKLTITFFVKLLQDVVLEDHLVVGEKCLLQNL